MQASEEVEWAIIRSEVKIGFVGIEFFLAAVAVKSITFWDLTP